VKTVVCPTCGDAVRPRRVVYGLPTVEATERAARGEILLGGCDPGVPGVDEMPEFGCPSCGQPFRVADTVADKRSSGVGPRTGQRGRSERDNVSAGE
jgi:hypothetical protein